MSVILKELKNREKLGLIERRVPTSQEITDLKQVMANSAKTQAALGLGNPVNAIQSVQAQVDKLGKWELAKKKAITLAKLGVFNLVESPNEKTFPRFVGAGTVRLGKLPKYIMARLSSKLETVTCAIWTSSLDPRLEPDTYKAAIPLMPNAVQALAQRAVEAAPGGKFHLLYEPNWQKQPKPTPQRDPVLLYEVGARFFVIGHWDSDAELINKELIKEK